VKAESSLWAFVRFIKIPNSDRFKAWITGLIKPGKKGGQER
jgi:hypothetical protein